MIFCQELPRAGCRYAAPCTRRVSTVHPQILAQCLPSNGGSNTGRNAELDGAPGSAWRILHPLPDAELTSSSAPWDVLPTLQTLSCGASTPPSRYQVLGVLRPQYLWCPSPPFIPHYSPPSLPRETSEGSCQRSGLHQPLLSS